jgi:hypothetical protein
VIPARAAARPIAVDDNCLAPPRLQQTRIASQLGTSVLALALAERPANGYGDDDPFVTG